MTTLVQRVSKRSLDFVNQRKAYLLREGKHESWETIAGKVVYLQGEHPCWGTVRNIVSEFNVSRGHRQYNYKKSGRKPWKLPPDVQSYIIRRMLSLRSTEVALESSYRRYSELLNDESTATPH